MGAQRARKELQETQALINLSLGGEIEKAQQAAAKKKYRLAALYCTRLLSADGAGKFGADLHWPVKLAAMKFPGNV